MSEVKTYAQAIRWTSPPGLNGERLAVCPAISGVTIAVGLLDNKGFWQGVLPPPPIVLLSRTEIRKLLDAVAGELLPFESTEDADGDRIVVDEHGDALDVRVESVDYGDFEVRVSAVPFLAALRRSLT